MKNFKSVLIFLVLTPYILYSSQTKVTISAKQHQPIQLLIGFLEEEPLLYSVAQIIKRDCIFMGQLVPEINKLTSFPDKPEKIKFFYKDKGIPFIVFLNHSSDKSAIEWRLYDTMKASMIKGKKYLKKGPSADGWGHAIADDIWHALTNQPGIFSTKIAYCKREKCDGKIIKHILISDYDGTNKKVLVDTPTINVAPRWNADPNNPLVFYSTFADSNMRLMVCDMNKKQNIASNFDGLNMLPSFSPDGKKIVYCLSRGDGCCQLYYYAKGVFKRLTHNYGNNISPTLADEKTVFFCSDFKAGKPQLYAYHLDTDKLEIIMSDSCACPRYCKQNNTLVFSKVEEGFMQLFSYNLATKQCKQLTFDDGNKDECSWSPCGNYVLYSVQKNDQSRIVMFNLITKKQLYITPASEHCSYPDWSLSFSKYPIT